MSNILELKSINKKYTQGDENIEIIRDINLEIKKGELISIMGSSGSGKSTLLHIAGLLDQQFSGDVIIDSKSTKTISNKERDFLRLHKIGFIYQYHHLLKDFNARENIAMPMIISGCSNNKAVEEADQLLSSLGLYNRRNNFPGELSGGEQQRVAIARSLANNPEIILADEPTGNLDNESSDIVINMFIKLAKERNLAAIIVTHNPLIAKKMDRAFEIKNGSLIKI